MTRIMLSSTSSQDSERSNTVLINQFSIWVCWLTISKYLVPANPFNQLHWFSLCSNSIMWSYSTVLCSQKHCRLFWPFEPYSSNLFSYFPASLIYQGCRNVLRVQLKRLWAASLIALLTTFLSRSLGNLIQVQSLTKWRTSCSAVRIPCMELSVVENVSDLLIGKSKSDCVDVSDVSCLWL